MAVQNGLRQPNSRVQVTRGRIKKAGYSATPVACGWAGAVLEKVTRAFGQEL